jgi:hypothetical protein
MTDFYFYLARVNGVQNTASKYSHIVGKLYDKRDFLTINLDGTRSKFKSAQVNISKKITSSNADKPETYSMAIGNNNIGNPNTVGSADIKYSTTDASGNTVNFVNNTEYVIKVTADFLNDNGVRTTYFAEFGTDTNYPFLYRADKGDTFNTVISFLNEPLIESGTDINVSCPMVFAIPNVDTRVPETVSFLFDEVNKYPNQSSTANTEQLVNYNIVLNYNASGNYTLPQAADKLLTNDKAYFVTVTAQYNYGYTTTKKFPRALHVISKPVIHSVVPYGLDANQDGAGDAALSSVMNVLMNGASPAVNLTALGGNITFYLKQGSDVMYKTVMNVNNTADNDGKFLYTINKSDLTKVWTTTAPTQNSNKSYSYDVVASVNTMTVYYDAATSPNEFIEKSSTAVAKTFTSDVISLANVTALNAWIAASGVAGSGSRTVDISNATTAAGYNAAPELGIVGKFSKTDFYGSGITDGFFKDLDTVNTNHKFSVIVNNINGTTTKTVTTLHQLQGYGTKTDQELYTELFGLTGITNANGLFANIPGPAGTLGSAQKPIYFWIPNAGLFEQGDSVTVSIAIQPVAGETTRPAATESAAQVVVAKINKYEMFSGQASEVRFAGSGATATLTVPINNAKTVANELYFSHAIFTSNMSAPNDTNEVAVSNDGVFDISVVNPSKRGEGAGNACVMQVRYKIADPNGGTITGPISSDYTLNLMDDPDLTNFTVSNYSYETFNDNGASKVKFDVAFQTVANKGIDGVYVYFRSNNNDVNAANDIPLTLLKDVKRSAGNSQANLSHTLQSAAPADAALASGIKIKDKDGADSANSWLNFRSGEIVFKPYYNLAFLSDATPVIVELETVKTVYNIPTIPMPTNMVLTGGVKESHTATKSSWDDALATYSAITSSVTASYKLLLDASLNDVSGAVTNHSYTIDLSSRDASSAVTLKLQVKISALDNTSYLSQTVELNFTVASIAVTGMTNDVKRGSNNATLRVARGDYAITPAGGANVTEVKLIDNVVVANTDPEAAQVKVLTCSSTADAVQPVGPTVNEYNLTTDGYALGDDIDMRYRLKAGVQYTTQYGAAAATPSSSTALFLTLASPITKYIVATKPEIQLGSTYRVTNGGTYNGRIALDINVNANGLHAEGVLSVVFILAQEGNFTNPALSDSGIQYVVSFETATGLTKSYTVGVDASLNPTSTDNLGATEVHELSVTDLPGFSEGGAGTRTLVMGNLLANDASTLYLEANSGFNTSLPITAVSVVATRLGNDISFRDVTPAV